MELYKDNNGIVGFPLQLLVITIILAISLPLAYIAYESYDRSQTEQNLRNELDKIISNAKQLSNADVGNSDIVVVKINNGVFAKVEEVKIGDEPGGDFRSAIRYKLSNRGEKTILIKPPLFLATFNGDLKTLSIKGTGKIIIKMETKSGVDFDEDGDSDIYLELSLI